MGQHKAIEIFVQDFEHRHSIEFSDKQREVICSLRGADSYVELAELLNDNHVLDNEQLDAIYIFFARCSVEELHDFIGGWNAGGIPAWYGDAVSNDVSVGERFKANWMDRRGYRIDDGVILY
jgi:hypothetical protein